MANPIWNPRSWGALQRKKWPNIGPPGLVPRRMPTAPYQGMEPTATFNRPLAQSNIMPPAAKRSMIGGTTAALGKRSWDKDLLGEVLGDIMGDVDTTPLPGQRVGETNIGELSLLQQAGPEVGDISTSMDRFWKKKLGYA